MNIFYVDHDPVKAAQALVDRHVVKMILESAQLLSTAHRVLDDVLQDERNTVLYKATHVNHPSCLWVRRSSENYYWLLHHLYGLLNEYTFRYGKIHKVEGEISSLLCYLPNNIEEAEFTPPPPAMAQEYIVSNDSLTNYRNYYKLGKRHLFRWKKRNPPDWLNL